MGRSFTQHDKFMAALCLYLVVVITLCSFISRAESKARLAQINDCEALDAHYGDIFRVKKGFYKDQLGTAMQNDDYAVTLSFAVDQSVFMCGNLERVK